MNSVGTRLFAAFVALIVLVILMISFTLIVLLRNNPLVQRQDLAKLANVSSSITRLDLPGVELNTAQDEVKVQQLASTYRVLVTDSAGAVLLDSAQPNGPPLPLRRFRTARQDPLFPQVMVGQVRDSNLTQWLFVARAFDVNRVLVTAAQPRQLAALVFFGENLLLPMAEDRKR